MTRQEIETKVIALVSEALDVRTEEVTPHSSLIDDLGAESIDFLDIRFRIETEFDIQVDDGELWEGSLSKKHPELLTSEGLTTEGLLELKRQMPDFRWDRFSSGVRQGDLPRLLTVRTIVDFLCEELNCDS